MRSLYLSRVVHRHRSIPLFSNRKAGIKWEETYLQKDVTVSYSALEALQKAWKLHDPLFIISIEVLLLVPGATQPFQTIWEIYFDHNHAYYADLLNFDNWRAGFEERRERKIEQNSLHEYTVRQTCSDPENHMFAEYII